MEAAFAAHPLRPLRLKTSIWYRDTLAKQQFNELFSIQYLTIL